MITKLLPERVDNTFHGHTLALWLFALLLLLKVAMSLNSIVNGYSVASTADGIPLDAFPPDAARTVVAMFAIWGLAHFTICVVCMLVLARYRSAVPFMLALLLLEHLSRKLILQVLPIARIGTPPGFYVNLGLVALMIVGLALSLWRRAETPAPA